MASGLAVYASWGRLPDRHARLASRCWSALLDGLSTRKVPLKGFQYVSVTSFPPFPSLLGASQSSPHRHGAGGGGRGRGAPVVANHRPTGTGPGVADAGAGGAVVANHRPTGTGPGMAGGKEGGQPPNLGKTGEADLIRHPILRIFGGGHIFLAPDNSPPPCPAFSVGPYYIGSFAFQCVVA